MLRQGYKQTEIGVIPEDWEVKELGVLGDVRMCKRVFQNQTSEYGDIPFFKIGTFGKEPDAYISRKHFEELKLKFSYPKFGEILISAAGTIGRTVVYNGEESYFQDSNIVWIENREDIISNKLLKYVLEVVKYNTEGGTIQRLYNNILKSTLFVCPPLAEQEAIASALSDADAWIDSLEQFIAKKRLIKQGAMQTLLTPQEDWEVKKLGEVADVYRGGSPRPIQDYITNKSNGINWIKIGDTSSSGKYITSANEKIIPEGEKNSRKVFVGDFLLSNSMSFGRPYILKIEGCIHDGWLVLQNYKETFNTEFLYYLLTSKYMLDQYKSKAAGSSVLNLNKELVSSVEVLIPSLSEQERIARILSDMDAELEALEQQLAKARQIKQGMMQELLTGRIRLV